MKQFTSSDWPALIASLRRPYQDSYFAMYSSLFGGIVTDPALMILPIDDHMVHRGDGIFEAIKTVNGFIYNLQGHLDRLDQSARALFLTLPASRAELTTIIRETVQVAGKPDCMIRVFVSRGPGSFAVNPYDCPAPQLYVVVTSLGTPFMKLHPEGGRICTSQIAAKSAGMSHIKNCNYAPNVLMKKEAVDAGVNFAAGFDEQGFLTEGAIENMGIVTADQRLLFPKLDRILAGTTMLRVMELAETLTRSGILKTVAFADISRKDILAASEFLLTGTTINVAAGVEFDGRPIGTGKPGPVYRALESLLEKDMRANNALLNRIFS
jgi:branched-subunit amino acid aminotransferase/4-amino-4-deoxychorismate lyase